MKTEKKVNRNFRLKFTLLGKGSYIIWFLALL